MKLFLRYWLPVILWMCLIFGASSDTKSVQHSDGILIRFLRFLHINVTEHQREVARPYIRKGAHMAEYAVLAVLLWRALQGERRTRAWSNKIAAGALALCVLYAATDEFHQSFVPGRSASIGDVLIDTVGAAIGLTVIWLVIKRRASAA